jgi:hypothetical protein
LIEIASIRLAMHSSSRFCCAAAPARQLSAAARG